MHSSSTQCKITCWNKNENDGLCAKTFASVMDAI